MARGLYRFYLYFVAISLAESVTVSLGNLLYQLFQYTPLRGGTPFQPAYPITSPDSTALRQAVIEFVVTTLIAGGLGALHYWLIRRDSASDPDANESGVRSFLLNWYVGGAALTAIIAAVIAMEQVGLRYNPTIAYPVAIALAALVFALALELERRRLTPTRGAALDFERLRRDGVPFIVLLAVVIYTLYNAANKLERVIGHQLGFYNCSLPTGPYLYPTCVGDELTGALLGAAVAAGPWLWLLWLGRRDAGSLLRQIALLLGWVIGGMVFLAVALQPAAEYVLRRLTPDTGGPRLDSDYFSRFDFGPWVVVAVVALAVYGWMLRTRAEPAMNTNTVRLTLRALAGLVLAAPFWYGVYSILLLIAGMIGPATVTPAFATGIVVTSPAPSPSLLAWEHAGSYLIAGAGYIPLAFWLGAGSRRWEINGPRRGFVLGLLGASALVTASAAVSLLYTLLTSLLSVPQPNRIDVARTASAALLTGLALGGLYLVIAIRERQFAGPARAPTPVAPAPLAPPTAAPTAPMTPMTPVTASLDEILTQLEGGLISKDIAAARIRDLARAGAL